MLDNLQTVFISASRNFAKLHPSILKYRALSSARLHPTKCLLKNSVAFGHDRAAARGR